jgi:hypothetical protein
MSNAKANLMGTVVHVFASRTRDHTVYGVCGAEARYTDEHAGGVTCKRCLASLAKRDREFQRKARAQFRADKLGRQRGWAFQGMGKTLLQNARFPRVVGANGSVWGAPAQTAPGRKTDGRGARPCHRPRRRAGAVTSALDAAYAAPNTRGGPLSRVPRLAALALVTFWCAVAYSCTGCAPDMTRAHIGLGYDVDPEPWEYAVHEWYRASGGRVALTIDAEDTTAAEIGVGWDSFQPRGGCAYTEVDTHDIRLQMYPSETCQKYPRTTALHELGHAMGALHSTDPRDVMYPHNTGTETLTAADVAMVVP